MTDERETQRKLTPSTPLGSGGEKPNRAPSRGVRGTTRASVRAGEAPQPNADAAPDAEAAHPTPDKDTEQSKPAAVAATPDAPEPPAAPELPGPPAADVPAADVPAADVPAAADAPASEPTQPMPRLQVRDVIDRIRRLPPAITVLTLGSIGSLLFSALAVTNHTTPVAVLLSAGVITGLVFAIDAALAAHSSWSAGVYGETGRAALMSVVSFFFMLVCAGSLAAVTIMILVLNGWP